MACGVPKGKASSSTSGLVQAHEWRIRQIIGKKVIRGQIHYLVDWEPTLEPLDALGKARVLVQKFEAKEKTMHRAMDQTGQRKRRSQPKKQRHTRL